MSKTAIINTGRNFFIKQLSNSKAIVLDQVIFANINSVTGNTEVNLSGSMPSASQIVHKAPVTQAGLINDRTVVYSVVLDTSVGDFSFNYIGLVNSATNTLCMVMHIDTTKKIKTSGQQQGNTITESIWLEMDNASTSTGITVNAETWQIDFSKRLAGEDESIRLTNLDLYGRFSIKDGLAITKSGSNCTVAAGLAYIAGFRVNHLASKTLAVSNGQSIYIDAWIEGTVTGAWSVNYNILAGTNLSDYKNGVTQHYVERIASVDSSGNLTKIVGKKVLTNLDLDSSTNSTAEDKAATPKAVKAAYDLANTANTTSYKKNQNVIIDKSNPQLNMYNPNKHGVSIKLKDDNEFEILYLNDFGWSVKARYIESSNTFQFLNLNGFTINSKEALKQGDHGIGGKSIVDAGDGSYPKGCGFIYLPKAAVASPEPSIPLVGLNIISNSDQWGGQILLRDGATAPRVFVRTIGYGEFKGSAEFITTSNIANYVSSKAEYWYLDGTKQSPRVVSTSTELEFINIYDEFTLFIPQLRVKGSDGITRWLDINTFFYEYGSIYGINVALSPDDNKVLISCAQSVLITSIQKRSGLPVGYAPSSDVKSGEFRLKVLKLK